jgi:DNA-directed RNA polymerase specialized sigma24 family protein
VTPDLSERWDAVVPHRQALVYLALAFGAGVDADDVVHRAMEKAVQRPNLDIKEPLPYLRQAVVNLCRDLHRREAYTQRLIRHHGLVPHPRDPTDDLCGHYEAVAAAQELVNLLGPELYSMCLRLAAREITWHEAAEEQGMSEPMLRSQIRRAYLRVRALVIRWRAA